MSRAPLRHAQGRDRPFSRNAEIYDTTIGWRFVNPLMKKQYGVDSMPETGENVAEDFFRSSRADPGRLCRAQPEKRPWSAQGKNGRLAKEIVPVSIPQRPRPIRIIVDKGTNYPAPRRHHGRKARQAADALSARAVRSPPATASGVPMDGAAALIVGLGSSRQEIRPHPHRPRPGRCGDRPPAAHHGLWSCPGDEEALRYGFGIKPSDFDVIELNEAFASQGSRDTARSRASPTTRRM